MSRDGEGDPLAITARGPPAGAARLDGTLLQRGDAIGAFVVEAVLGQGGSGVVLLARDPLLDRSVALKLLRPTGAVGGSADEGRVRLLREAQAMARLRHPNVVAVYQVGEVASQVFVAMEYVAGGNLRAWLAAEPRPWRAILERFVLAGRGLAAAHAAGMVHRDFKPDNVMVAGDGGVLVTDFGLVGAAIDAVARRERDPSEADDPGLTRTDAVVGTPRYMAPEQHDSAAVDARADQFSFCAALYEGLYGAPPFAGTTREELAASVRDGVARPVPATTGVPGYVQRAVTRGLRRAPDDRHPSMAALLGALDPRRHRRAVALRAIGAALLVALAGGVAAAGAADGGPTERLLAAVDPARDADVGGDSPAPCGPGSPSYMPLAVGNWWRYGVTEGHRGTTEVKTIRIDHAGPIGADEPGLVAYRLRRDDGAGGATRWLRDLGHAIVWDAETWYAPDGAIRSSRRYAPHRLRAPQDCRRTIVGARWDERYDRIDLSPGGERRVTPQIETWQVVGIERVTVPAGTFRAVRFHRRNAAERIESTYWFAPGVGKVKEESPPKESEVLLEYHVAGASPG